MWLLGSKPLHFTKQNMASMMLHQQKRNQTLGANEKKTKSMELIRKKLKC